MKTEKEAKENKTEPEEAVVEETTEETVQLLPEIQRAQEEAADLKRRLLLVAAEYENYRKRTAATRSQAYAEGRADVVVKLFPIADNLDRALVSCGDEKTRQGIQMVVKAFEKLLEEEKIEVIDPVGEEFDANKCEAIMAIEPQAGETSGTVKEVYLKGYEQNGKVLRFAQVVVIK